MKTTILFFAFLLCFCTGLFAYDYQTIQSNQTAIFVADGYSIQGMKIDSVKIQENDSVFYPLKRILQYNESGCFTPYGASWLGEKILISEKWNHFINQSDTVRIKTGAELGESWISFSKEGLYTMEAKVTGHDIQSFLGIEDSIKTLSFQAYDANNTPVEHFWNDKTLKISKNYGIIQGIDFTLFSSWDSYSYNRNLEYALAGLSNPEIGVQNFTWLDVWDFQPGDELHISQSDWMYGSGRERNSIIKYIERENAGNKISYKIHVKEIVIGKEYQQGILYDSIIDYKNYENTEEIYPSEAFDKLPGEPIIDDNFASIYVMQKDEDGSYKHFGDELNYEGNQCWAMPIVCGDCLASDYIYRKGLGGPYHSCSFAMGNSSRQLVYYKKGGVEWGNPLTITGIKKIDTKAISVVYDRAGEAFQINLESLNQSCLFELIDVTGKKVIQSKLTPAHHSIPAGHIQNGIYIYRLTVNGKTIRSEKIFK